jgi:hypothetical protein
MRSRLILATVALAALAAAPLAAADTFAFGDAKDGRLQVTTGVVVTERDVGLNGLWTDPRIGCLARKRLRVAGQIDFVASDTGKTTRVRRARTGAVVSCAEGGPNFGFWLRAKPNGLACPDGTWKPGFYTFVVHATYVDTGLRSTLSLGLDATEPC